MKKEKVLIVEDEMDLLDLIDFNLTRAGYVTAAALDGRAALKKVGEFAPDLVVLDLMLPGVDGWSICRALRERGNDVPVVMLTAKVMPEDKVMGLEAGASDYITKPFSPRELLIRMDRLLERKRVVDVQRMIVHEITNRISTIGCYSEVLSRKDPVLSREERIKYLKDIGRHVRSTRGLMDEARAIISAVEGGGGLGSAECDVVEITQSAVESLVPEASRKNIRINVRTGEELPTVEANPYALKQVLLNIMGNAVKYGREGGSVEVAVTALPGEVSVSVKDDGPGIPEDEVPHIFSPGYRGRLTHRIAEGSGLGLYIVKVLVEKMDARVEVRSNPAGSEFRVLLKAPGPVGDRPADDNGVNEP